MAQFPMKFKVCSFSKEGVETRFSAKEAYLPEITCAIPKEFQGPGGGYSPEDLFTLSLLTCFVATFKVFTVKTGLSFDSIEAEGELTIDKDNEKKVPALSSIDVTVNLLGAGDKEKAKKVLQDAEKYCLVSQAINSKKTYHYNID